MKKRQEASTGLSQTAALLVIAYLDVAILGGAALTAHWIIDSGQVVRSQTVDDCSAEIQNRDNAGLNRSITIPDAIGSEADPSRCYNAPQQSVVMDRNGAKTVLWDNLGDTFKRTKPTTTAE